MSFTEQDSKNLVVIAKALDPDKDRGASGVPYSNMDAFGGFVWIPLGIALISLFLGWCGGGPTFYRFVPFFGIVSAVFGIPCFLLDKILGLPKKESAYKEELEAPPLVDYGLVGVAPPRNAPEIAKFLNDVLKGTGPPEDL